MSEEFRCGRRDELFGMGDRFPGPDTWQSRGDSYHMEPTCSYCGSISQEAFFAAIEAGAEIGPTDKNYKVYVEVPNPTPNQLRVLSGASGGGGYNPGPAYTRVRDLDDVQRAVLETSGWSMNKPDDWVRIGPVGPKSHGKFYFQHLDASGRARFIELVNAKGITFGYPGHLYVTPYFARREAGDLL